MSKDTTGFESNWQGMLKIKHIVFFRLDEMKRQYEMKKTELSEKINSSRHLGTGRVLRAFPEMEHRDHKELLEQMEQYRHVNQWK